VARLFVAAAFGLGEAPSGRPPEFDGRERHDKRFGRLRTRRRFKVPTITLLFAIPLARYDSRPKYIGRRIISYNLTVRRAPHARRLLTKESARNSSFAPAVEKNTGDRFERNYATIVPTVFFTTHSRRYVTHATPADTELFAIEQTCWPRNANSYAIVSHRAYSYERPIDDMAARACRHLRRTVSLSSTAVFIVRQRSFWPTIVVRNYVKTLSNATVTGRRRSDDEYSRRTLNSRADRRDWRRQVRN